MAAAMAKSRYMVCTAISFFLVRNTTPKVFENRHCSPKILARMAGHSHWQNIKFKKAHKDFQRSKVFGKLAMEIITTVREGGSDPTLNSRLGRILERAKMAKMPKSSIENAVKSGAGTKDNPYQHTMFEARGPGACGLLIDILTTNKVKVKSEMATILRKNGGSYKDGGSVSFQFDNKGIVTLKDLNHNEKEHTPENYPDEDAFNQVEEVAIEVGAENLYFTTSEDEKIVIKFICDTQDLKHVADALTLRFSDQVLSTELEYIPNTLVSLTEGQMERAEKLIDHINNYPDVVRIYDNIKDYPSSTCKLFANT